MLLATLTGVPMHAVDSLEASITTSLKTQTALSGISQQLQTATACTQLTWVCTDKNEAYHTACSQLKRKLQLRQELVNSLQAQIEKHADEERRWCGDAPPMCSLSAQLNDVVHRAQEQAGMQQQLLNKDQVLQSAHGVQRALRTEVQAAPCWCSCESKSAPVLSLRLCRSYQQR